MRSAAQNILLMTALVAKAVAADIEHDPAAELASFQIAEGFEVNLFASETNGVIKPIQMRFDAQGRLWVIGSTVYPQIEPGQAPQARHGVEGHQWRGTRRRVRSRHMHCGSCRS